MKMVALEFPLTYRFGIPFNIVYGPSAKSGIILPEILTSELVINALKNAK